MNFTDIFTSQTKILEQLGGTWIIGMLVFCRSIAFTSTAPLIGHKTIPALVKVSFAALLTLILMPNLDVPSAYPKDYKFIYLIITNVLIGMLIGWTANLVIEITKVAGEMLDSQMALNAATIFDPGSQSQATLIGRFFDYMGLVIFISVGGMEKIIEGFYKSYNVFPILLYQINLNFDKLLKATGDVISIGILIVSPVLVILIIQDLILGLMSRAAPQINAFQISFSIKPSTALLILLVLLPMLLQIFASLFNNPMRFF